MEITKPTLFLDVEKCKRNIRRMADKACRNKVVFRPHFKTHQSHEVGRWFRELEVDKITVSSVSMAQYFAQDDWKDITISFPVNLLEIKEINDLARHVKLNLLVESPEVLLKLDQLLKFEAGVFIKVDTGYHRTGIPVENIEEIDVLVKSFSSTKNCRFKGFLVHNGHTYKATSVEGIKSIHVESVRKLKALKEKYINIYPGLILSLGDTPSMSVLEDFGAIDEIRPGNFVFYDLMQWRIGACTENDIAVAMVCPIVAKHLRRKQLVVYGGGVHFSKESIVVDDRPIYGKLVRFNEGKWFPFLSECFLISLSQEHGILQLDNDSIDKIEVGELVGILPVHSCLTADLQNHYHTSGSQIQKRI